MPDSSDTTGVAVAEVAEATDLAETLTPFQIEESLALSAEEEGLTPEIEAALAAYLEGAMEKRDPASHRLPTVSTTLSKRDTIARARREAGPSSAAVPAPGPLRAGESGHSRRGRQKKRRSLRWLR